MYRYTVESENPEWCLVLLHEKEFSHKEFTKTCEAGFIKYITESKEAFIANSKSLILKHLTELGFTAAPKLPITASYYFNPYDGLDRINDPELINLIKGKK